MMIVVLALLDDIPIMTIAYDNARIEKSPVRWNMGRVLTISSVLGILAVVQSFGLLIIGMEWMSNAHLQSWISIDRSHLQTLVFLQLVAAGHLMLFVTRTRNFFLKPPLPSTALFLAIVGTQIFAVLMCAFGWLVPPIPWSLIALAWVYMIIWVFILDLAKLWIYRIAAHRARHQSKFANIMNQSLHSHT
jgi:H+-transporting ATPase